MPDTHIRTITAREILDSRANPTVEATVELCCGARGTASVPSGASTGTFEARELRDGDPTRYQGKGVLRAVEHIETEIAQALTGKPSGDQALVDELLCSLDGTPDRSRLGANALLAVSLANAHAFAGAMGLPLYRVLGGTVARRMPVPMMNILNGGVHAANDIDVQEFMIAPIGAQSFTQAVQWCAEVYHALGALLRERSLATTVGDEGGFAPDLHTPEQAIELILRAVEKAGYDTHHQIKLCLDAAASEWYGAEGYCQPKSGRCFSTDQLIDYWTKLCDSYPILSLEDPLGEEDWAGWRELTRRLGAKVQLVGDDLFVTQTTRLQRGIDEGAGNCILIKPNQVGTLTETLRAIELAGQAGFGAMVSHRSGETTDTTIADLAVATGAGQIKTGAPCRGERTAKYSRLMQIELELGCSAVYGPWRPSRAQPRR